jgi:hypothetical protein
MRTQKAKDVAELRNWSSKVGRFLLNSLTMDGWTGCRGWAIRGLRLKQSLTKTVHSLARRQARYGSTFRRCLLRDQLLKRFSWILCEQLPGHSVKLDDLPWLIVDRITLLGITQAQLLKPRNGIFEIIVSEVCTRYS